MQHNSHNEAAKPTAIGISLPLREPKPYEGPGFPEAECRSVDTLRRVIDDNLSWIAGRLLTTVEILDELFPGFDRDEDDLCARDLDGILLRLNQALFDAGCDISVPGFEIPDELAEEAALYWGLNLFWYLDRRVQRDF